MKRTNNGPILSALILCTGLLFSCGQQKAKQESLAENEANEMIKMNTVALLLPVIPGRKCNKIASAFLNREYDWKPPMVNHPLISFSARTH